jgi:hypothetical protein
MKPVVLAVSLSLALAGPRSAGAQVLPTEPIAVGDGRVVIAAEVTATVAGEDPGFFNYTDYESSGVRNVRVTVGVQARANRWLQMLGELRIDQGTHVEPFAMYVRVRPWPNRRFDIQAGLVPPTFGAFARTTYGSTNVVIGAPLAYQYLTSLRPDALPATTADLLRMRGRGWLSSFPLGVNEADRGLPVINSVRAATGVQVHGVNGLVEWVGAVTTGSLSHPRDDNDGYQLAGRVIARPIPSIALGASAARGEFLDKVLESELPAGRRLEEGVQRSIGVDAEYSEGRFLARTEVIRSRWTLPVALTGTVPEPLDLTSFLVEGRYRILPGVQVAARAEHLSFDRIPVPGGMERWEAPVKRFEIALGYSVTRNFMVKTSWQRNFREGGRIREESLGAVQVVYWF